MDQTSTDRVKTPSIFKSCFENVPGMDNLKIALTNLYNMQQLNRKRVTLGIWHEEGQCRNNLLIVGPTGIGKTTAASIVGECYEKMGLVSNKELIATNYQALLGATPDETSNNVRQLMSSAIDRIVLIDDVEQFDDGFAYSPGHEMLDKIVEAYKDSNGTITIVATGEEQAVYDLLRKKQNFADIFDVPAVVLVDYSEEDLLSVAKSIAERMGYILDNGVDKKLIKEYQTRKGAPDFNYLNLFREMIVAASLNAATRVAGIRHASDLDVSLIKEEDFKVQNSKADDMESLDELLEQLNSLIGLDSVKEQVNTIVAGVKLAKKEEEYGISTGKGTMHMVFSGAPGTGKTTVARIVSKIYVQLGLLSRGQIVECSRSDLVSDVIGGTVKKTHAKVLQAKGGVLFIDEAYSVCRDKKDTFGLEAVDTLTKDIYNYKDDLLVILAGYDKEMDDFLQKNPGMNSRVPNKIHFEDYTTDELMRIFQKYVDDSGMLLIPEAEDEVRALLDEKSKAADFGNARGVENVFNDVVKNHQKRLASLNDEYISVNDIKIIRKEDIRKPSEQASKHDSVQEWYDELDSLVGLDSVKKQVKQMAAKVKVNQIRRERGLPTQGMPSLHTVFKGNAGTGKTTVARLIGNIYKGLGVLPTGKFVECTRSDVVGEYQGQTAQKMKEKIREAQGGVLFIDEVYSLYTGSNDNFGLEAINELVPAMENQRDNLMVIAAGYTDQVEDFLNTNQGLKSRFSNEIIFEDYSEPELRVIFDDMIEARSLFLADTPDVDELVNQTIAICAKKQDFGNGRGVRNLVEKLVQNQEERIADMLTRQQNLSDEAIQQIEKEDIELLLKTI